ncbi:MAG: thiamine phosphate synthase [Deltaproteobacteria bacterium]|nr:thiamine phosphate synthase [Deltaproteobacteria bacterium]
MKESRLLDANINRSAEGLRVLEDIARFRFDNQKMSSGLRGMRHDIRRLFKERTKELLFSRDSFHDVGVATSFGESCDARKNLKDTVLSNFKRVQEAFRTMEEILKTKGEYKAGKKIEALRFCVYSLEPGFLSLFSRRLPHGIYGILGEKFSLGRSNVEVAGQMVDAGIDIIQYREKLKDKSLKEMFRECRDIRKITEEAGVPFIINDHAAIALMVGADGIHQGQDDLPVKDLRKIAPHMMIGCSTHSPCQAGKAVEDGADYIGVGPIFATRTKEDVCDAVGFEYLDHVVKNHDIPFVAIGGIKRHNLGKVVSRGAKTICLVTEIIGAKDIKSRIKEIKQIIGEVK